MVLPVAATEIACCIVANGADDVPEFASFPMAVVYISPVVEPSFTYSAADPLHELGTGWNPGSPASVPFVNHGIKLTLSLTLSPEPPGFDAFIGPVMLPHQLQVALRLATS